MRRLATNKLLLDSEVSGGVQPQQTAEESEGNNAQVEKKCVLASLIARSTLLTLTRFSIPLEQDAHLAAVQLKKGELAPRPLAPRTATDASLPSPSELRA